MEYSEGVIREFLTVLVSDALVDSKPIISVKFAQERFVKTDPASIICTWPLQMAGTVRRSKEFTVIFSGDSLATFVGADQDQLAKLRAAVIDSIRARCKAFDPADANIAYPFLCMIDKIDAFAS